MTEDVNYLSSEHVSFALKVAIESKLKQSNAKSREQVTQIAKDVMVQLLTGVWPEAQVNVFVEGMDGDPVLARGRTKQASAFVKYCYGLCACSSPSSDSSSRLLLRGSLGDVAGTLHWGLSLRLGGESRD